MELISKLHPPTAPCLKLCRGMVKTIHTESKKPFALGSIRESKKPFALGSTLGAGG